MLSRCTTVTRLRTYIHEVTLGISPAALLRENNSIHRTNKDGMNSSHKNANSDVDKSSSIRATTLVIARKHE